MRKNKDIIKLQADLIMTQQQIMKSDGETIAILKELVAGQKKVIEKQSAMINGMFRNVLN